MRFTRIVLCSIVVVAVCTSIALAADFEQRKAAQERSLKQGLGVPEVNLLDRVAGPGRETIASTILDRFAQSKSAVKTAGQAKKETMDDRLVYSTSEWSLEVIEDGTAVRYRNYEHLEKSGGPGKAVEARPSEETLEQLGRKFVTENLAGLVELGEKDALVPLYTEFLISQGGATQEGAKSEQQKVHASTIVFGRTYNGIHVVGPGSKIAVMFDLNGNAYGFDYDWPTYGQSETKQAVAGVQEIHKRAETLAGVQLKSKDVETSRFECGYFDAGVRKRDADAPIQAGCLVQAVEKKLVDADANKADAGSGYIEVATVNAIPAGTRVMEDKSWPQAVKSLGREVKAREEEPKDNPQQPR